jgi:hypothetical protein
MYFFTPFTSLNISYLQKELWAAEVLRESTLAVGASGSGQTVTARNKTQLERKLNLHRLAEAFVTLEPKDYLERVISIMHDEM